MIGIEKPRIETAELAADGTYGKIVVEPLERGYGVTLGNSLRRILLSSLPGYAITSVKIDGVLHEFSTVPGVKEDVTEIILNLKNVILKIHGEGPKTVYIDASGEGEVLAGDIKCDSEVEIINPEYHICTLDKDAHINMELTVNKGRGYVSAEQNKKLMQPVIGVIAIDSIYTPILKANYTIDDIRVGQEIGFDKLTLEVWTDGTIPADEAVSLASKIMSEYLSLFIGTNDAWAELDQGRPIETDAFEQMYTDLLNEIFATYPKVKVMLISPYIMEGLFSRNTEEQPDRLAQFRIHVSSRIEVVRRLAQRYDLPFVDMQAVFDEACARADASCWCTDGVHPTPAGHELIKRAWLEAFATMNV